MKLLCMCSTLTKDVLCNMTVHKVQRSIYTGNKVSNFISWSVYASEWLSIYLSSNNVKPLLGT